MEFARGEVTKDIEVIGDTNETGTKITFKPDAEIFDTVIFERFILENRFREMAFLNKEWRFALKI